MKLEEINYLNVILETNELWNLWKYYKQQHNLENKKDIFIIEIIYFSSLKLFEVAYCYIDKNEIIKKISDFEDNEFYEIIGK